MRITSTMLRNVAAMPEQAMGPCLLLLAEQLEADEAKRASAAQRQAEYASRQRLRQSDISMTSASHQTDISVTSDASRVDNLSSLPSQVERVEEDPPVVPPATSEPPFFDAFWDAYPKRAGGRDRKAAVKAFRAASKRAAPAQIIEGALRYANYCRLSDKEGTELVRQARTWLNADGWTETYEISRSTNGPQIHAAWNVASAVLAEQDRREGICREGREDDIQSLPEPEGRTRIFGRVG